MSYPEPLRQEHQLESFSSGKEALDSWLRDSALEAGRAKTATTFVWCAEGSTEVVAYYSFAAMSLVREELPNSLARGNMQVIPAVLLARLALDRRYQGQGLGKTLLIDALERAVIANRAIAVRFLVVDALDQEAHAFYEKNGFRGIDGSRRLYRKMSDIEATLAQLN